MENYCTPSQLSLDGLLISGLQVRVPPGSPNISSDLPSLDFSETKYCARFCSRAELRSFTRGESIWDGWSSLCPPQGFGPHGTQEKSKPRPFKPEKGHPEKLNQSLSVDVLEWYDLNVIPAKKKIGKGWATRLLCFNVDTCLIRPSIPAAINCENP